MIITIDGPAGTGKSTVAQRLAQVLQFEYLDTGAMYRMIALKVLSSAVSLEDSDQVANVAGATQLEFDQGAAILDGGDVTHRLREPEVSAAASVVAQNPAVREILVSQQQAIAKGCDIVCEGRDQGTIVFPHADFKFFLTAAEEIRARRRMEDLQRQGTEASFNLVLSEQRERDARDETRSIAPLQPAADAVIVDSSEMTIDEVVTHLQAIIRKSHS
ncbi:Cytidylate kinase [Thalassoglobus neptunius]|uniref:Cytidylate kinase n=1 Tax=Thalassoglobus neptunius TaxID=1938619 RepID=A0A5C5WZX7_9PLAN|nr:(d)CMP kinase [Thalassoglobus neptunius]TWT55453.1 Cytidylate kinase [Thalassoglobus neptunius]